MWVGGESHFENQVLKGVGTLENKIRLLGVGDYVHTSEAQR